MGKAFSLIIRLMSQSFVIIIIVLVIGVFTNRFVLTNCGTFLSRFFMELQLNNVDLVWLDRLRSLWSPWVMTSQSRRWLWTIHLSVEGIFKAKCDYLHRWDVMKICFRGPITPKLVVIAPRLEKSSILNQTKYLHMILRLMTYQIILKNNNYRSH